MIKSVDIDSSLIKDGDLLLIRRYDGIEPMLMVATGSHVGHMAMTLWENNTLWVVEAQSALYFDSQKQGIQRNKYADWLRFAQNAEYEVVWLPMREDVRNSSFNATKAWNFFKRVEGDPYGHDKAVFAWIDTESENFF